MIHKSKIIIVFVLHIIVVTTLVVRVTSAFVARPVQATKIKWNARLYAKNPDYVEVTLNTTEFVGSTCFGRLTVNVSFTDALGRKLGTKKFTVNGPLRYGYYVAWFQHGLAPAAAKGERIDYTYFNCGSRLSKGSSRNQNIFKRIFGRIFGTNYSSTLRDGRDKIPEDEIKIPTDTELKESGMELLQFGEPKPKS